jgi:hypothetical protein
MKGLSPTTQSLPRGPAFEHEDEDDFDAPFRSGQSPKPALSHPHADTSPMAASVLNLKNPSSFLG